MKQYEVYVGDKKVGVATDTENRVEHLGAEGSRIDWIQRALVAEAKVAGVEAQARKWYDSSRQESLRALRAEGKVIALESAIQDALAFAEADEEDLSLEPWASLKAVISK